MNDQTPVTKADLAAVADQVVNQIREYVDQSANRIREYVDESANRIREYVEERTRDMQTELPRAFADYNNSAGVRFRKI